MHNRIFAYIYAAVWLAFAILLATRAPQAIALSVLVLAVAVGVTGVIMALVNSLKGQ